MKYEEFKDLKEIKDSNNPFSTLYQLETGEKFYISLEFINC